MKGKLKFGCDVLNNLERNYDVFGYRELHISSQSNINRCTLKSIKEPYYNKIRQARGVESKLQYKLLHELQFSYRCLICLVVGIQKFYYRSTRRNFCYVLVFYSKFIQKISTSHTLSKATKSFKSILCEFCLSTLPKISYENSR